jgi:ribosomal protein S18 acetylase RimI-like enzyme
MTLSLRPEAEADEPFLRRLITGAISQESGAEYWPEAMRTQLLDMQYSARRQSLRNRFPQGESCIVLFDGMEAGWLFVARLKEEVRLADILILPEYRGKGAGNALIRQLIGTAGRLPVRLSVDAGNTRAARLYERLGFLRTGGDEVHLEMEYTAGGAC